MAILEKIEGNTAYISEGGTGIVILRMDTVEYLRQVFQVLLLAIQDFWDMFI